jgi:hypothetical protein
MGRAAHRWREAGRLRVALVRSVCDCGCGRELLQVVGPNSRTMTFPLGGQSSTALRRVNGALSVGRELVAIWERFKSALA